MCGENLQDPAARGCRVGSPPRVRGKPHISHVSPPSHRITPACAGKTRNTASPSSSPRDHPRVCGENAYFLVFCRFVPGSPPRVRGKHFLHCHLSFLSGITPACAGKTRRPNAKRHPGQDHPRVCGENRVFSGRRARQQGSPPRVRGKHFSPSSITSIRGITPACAGKTRGCMERLPHGEDHPRVCGENHRGQGRKALQEGSPPRVRGKHGCTNTECISLRITPACAGKTGRVLWKGIPVRDHPRVCGENS